MFRQQICHVETTSHRTSAQITLMTMAMENQNPFELQFNDKIVTCNLLLLVLSIGPWICPLQKVEHVSN